MATIEHLITDMGNGCAFCSDCWQNLNNGDPQTKIPDTCPKCGAKFTAETVTPYPFGGSDFPT